MSSEVQNVGRQRAKMAGVGVSADRPASGVRSPRIAWALTVVGPLLVGLITVGVVWTHLGQRADERSAWSIGGPETMSWLLQDWLALVSVQTIVVVLVGCVVLSLIRRLPARAVGVIVLVAGANIATQLLKAVIPRPSYGVGVDNNSLPSGHTTVMVSLGLALIFVLPRALRPLAVFATTAAATLTGAATVLERWHRPSDVIAAYGVCAFWAGVGVLVAAWLQRTPDRALARSGGGARGRRFAVYLGFGVLGAVVVGATLVGGGMAAQGKPGNVMVGGIMLTATGVGSALLSSLVASGIDELRGRVGPRLAAGASPTRRRR